MIPLPEQVKNVADFHDDIMAFIDQHYCRSYIAKHLNIPQDLLQAYAFENNFKFPTQRDMIQHYAADVIEMAINGSTQKEIAEHFQCSSPAISNTLRKNNIGRGNTMNNKRKRDTFHETIKCAVQGDDKKPDLVKTHTVPYSELSTYIASRFKSATALDEELREIYRHQDILYVSTWKGSSTSTMAKRLKVSPELIDVFLDAVNISKDNRIYTPWEWLSLFRDEIFQHCNQGATATELAVQYNVTFPAVKSFLHLHSKEVERGKYTNYLRAYKREIHQKRCDGMKHHLIAAFYGVPTPSINSLFKDPIYTAYEQEKGHR